MPRFVSETKEIRAEWWDADEHAVIRKFSYMNRQRVSSRAAQARKVGEDTVVVIDRAEMHLAMLEEGIASWTLKKENGKAMPLRRSALEKLSFEDAEFIVEEIEKFNEKRTPEEQGSFRDGAGDGAEAGQGAGGVG